MKRMRSRLVGSLVAAGLIGVAAPVWAQHGPHADHGGPTHQTAPVPAPVHSAPGAHVTPGAHGEVEHEAHGGAHEPEPFNLIDLARFKSEKDRAALGLKDEHGNPVEPVTPYAYLLVNFAILMFIYYSAGKKPVAEGLATRRAQVEKELVEAGKLKAAAEAKLKTYTDKLDRLDDEIASLRAELVRAGEQERDRIVREAEEKAVRMRKDAEFLIDQEMRQLRNDLILHTVDVAANAAEQVLRTRVTTQDHERLGEEYLQSVAAPGAGRPSTAIADGRGGAA